MLHKNSTPHQRVQEETLSRCRDEIDFWPSCEISISVRSTLRESLSFEMIVFLQLVQSDGHNVTAQKIDFIPESAA